MTMVPAQNLSKQNHLLQYHKGSTNIDVTSALCDYNYGRGNIDEVYTTERFGGESIMSRKSQGYEYCSTDQSSCVVGSDILVIGDHHLHHHQYPILMADDQDESRTNSLNNDAPSSNSNKELEGGAGAGAGAGPGAGAACGGQDQERDHHHDHHGHDHDDREGWLQLSIGGHTGNIRQENKIHHHHHHDIQVLEPMSTARRGGGTGLNTIELDLLPGGGGGGMRSTSTTTFEGPSISTTHEYQHQNIIGGLNIAGRGSSMSNFGSGTNFSTPSLMYFQQYYPGSSSTSTSNFPQYHQADHQALNNWAFRPLIPQQYQQQQYAYASSSSSSSTSSLLMPQLGSTTTSYLARQFQLQPPVVDAGAASAGPTVDFRVVNPPRRPHSGIWFMLQASQNQAKEPILPQISKSFLRIKDGRMTVRLLIKYLVNKLRLDSESEIEITCRGQQLLPYLTLQHVRDNIWGPTLTLLPDSSSSTTDHVMVLHYSRSA